MSKIHSSIFNLARKPDEDLKPPRRESSFYRGFYFVFNHKAAADSVRQNKRHTHLRRLSWKLPISWLLITAHNRWWWSQRWMWLRSVCCPGCSSFQFYCRECMHASCIVRECTVMNSMRKLRRFISRESLDPEAASCRCQCGVDTHTQGLVRTQLNTGHTMRQPAKHQASYGLIDNVMMSPTNPVPVACCAGNQQEETTQCLLILFSIRVHRFGWSLASRGVLLEVRGNDV